MIDIEAMAVKFTEDTIKLAHGQGLGYSDQVELDLVLEEVDVLTGNLLPSFYHSLDGAPTSPGSFERGIDTRCGLEVGVNYGWHTEEPQRLPCWGSIPDYPLISP